MPELHPFQEMAAANARKEFDGGRPGALVVCPTGSGKTYIGAAVAQTFVKQGGRTLVLAYRGELLTQWARTFDHFGLKWAVEKADQKARGDSLFGRADVTLGSINTLQGKRLEAWPKDHFDLIIYDEAHHGTAKTSLAIMAHFHKAARLGLTATPQRGDGDDIQEVFGDCVYEYPLWKCIEDKFLVPPLFKRPSTRVDLSRIDGAGGDLNQGDLEDEIARHIEELVNGAKAEMGDRYAMAFTPKVASAQAMADGFRQVSIAARSVHGKSEDRDTVVGQFKALDYQCLCSCALLLEGFDAPAVSCLLMARPTKSGIVYRQMLGRGLRTYPGKTHCLVVDWAWNSGKHDLFRPIDLFDTSGMDLDILKIADGLIRAGKEEDPREAIKQAETIHRRDLAARVAVREREPRYKLIAFDPFQVGQLLGIPNRHVEGGRAPSKKAREQLEALKLKADGMSGKEAKRLLDELEDRRARGLATHRQICLLVSKGVPPEQARNFTYEDARGDLDLILGNAG